MRLILEHEDIKQLVKANCACLDSMSDDGIRIWRMTKGKLAGHLIMSRNEHKLSVFDYIRESNEVQNKAKNDTRD